MAGPFCDIIKSPQEYVKHDVLCHRTSERVVRDLASVIAVKQKIGKARTNPSGKKSLPELERELENSSQTVVDLFIKQQNDCDKNGNVNACVYTEMLQNFVKFFGRLQDVYQDPKFSPVRKELAKLNSGYLITELDPKGTGYEVLFDTGANMLAISPFLFSLMKQHIRVIGGSPEYGQNAVLVSMNDTSFKMGNIDYKPQLAAVTPVIDSIEGSRDRNRLIAIMGADFLFRHNWEVNYDASTITFDQNVENKLGRDRKQWIPIPLSIHPYAASYTLGIPVTVENAQMTFLLDTGLDGVIAFDNCYSVDTKKTKSRKSHMMAVEGTTENSKVEDVTFNIGPFSHREDLSITKAGAASALSGQKVCGLMGTQILVNYDYLYDPQTLSLYIRPRRQKGQAVKPARFGIIPDRTSIGKDRPAFLVKDVAVNSHADKAGIKKGDIITEIDGKTTDKITVLELFNIFYISKDKDLKITVLRDGRELKFKVRLKVQK